MKKFKSTIFLRFIISYLLVSAIIILFVVGFTYKNFIDIEKKQLSDSTQKTALQIKDSMDIRIRELKSLSVALAQDSDIMLLLKFSPDVEGSNVYYQAMNRLRLYAVSNEFVSNIYIKSNNNILCNNGLPMTKEIQEIEAMLEVTEKKEGLISNSNIMPDSVLFIKPLPSNGTNSSGYIVFTISFNALIKSISPILGINEGNVYFFNNYGDLIVSNERKKDALGIDELKQIIDNKGKKQIQNERINNQNNMVQYTYSEDTGLSYLTIMPYNQISSKFANAKMLTLIIGIVALLIGVILAYVFSYENYMPIKEMLHLVFPNHDYNNKNQKYKDQFKMISDMYCSKTNENENLQKRIKEQLSVTKRNYLSKLLMGQIKDIETIKTNNEYFDVKFNKDNYAVILINIHPDIGSIGQQIIDQEHIINSNIESAIKKYFELYGTTYLCSFEHNNIVSIVNANGLNIDILKQFAMNIQKVLMEQFKFQSTIGIGNIYNDIFSLENSYKEAVLAVEYKLVKGRNNIIEFKNINHSENVHNLKYFYLLKDKNKIYDYLQMGDLKNIENEFNELLETIKNSNFPISMIKCIYYEIINTAVEVASKFDIKMDELITLVRSETIDELRNNILGLYQDIYNELQKTYKYQNMDVIEQLLNYVYNNYWNSGISLEFLSQKFDISTSYISRMVKERTGKVFTDFLNKVRIDNSKEILLGEKTTINEISIKVGYIDVHTFIRNFKEYEQMTPGQYRKQFKKVSIIQ